MGGGTHVNKETRTSVGVSYLILNVHLQVLSVTRAEGVDRGEPNISNNGSVDKIEDWINSFQHEENDTKTQVLKKRKSQFRYSYLTYLKLLSELDLRTKSSEEKMKVEEDSEDIIFPPSHSLTQTDREYYNMLRSVIIIILMIIINIIIITICVILFSVIITTIILIISFIVNIIFDILRTEDGTSGYLRLR